MGIRWIGNESQQIRIVVAIVITVEKLRNILCYPSYRSFGGKQWLIRFWTVPCSRVHPRNLRFLISDVFGIGHICGFLFVCSNEDGRISQADTDSLPWEAFIDKISNPNKTTTRWGDETWAHWVMTTCSKTTMKKCLCSYEKIFVWSFGDEVKFC